MVIFIAAIILNKKVLVIEIEAYLNKIRPYIERSDTWKIQLIVAINLVSSKDTDEDRLIHSNNDNIKS